MMREPVASAPQADGQALRRHLEDRERLLFTSRNVSVGEMASTLAHEINQPVGTIANILRGALTRLSQWPEDGVPDAAEQLRLVTHLQQGLQLALDQAMFAARIMGRIREYTHSRQPRREAVDLLALLRESMTLLDWEFQRDGVATTLTIEGQSGLQTAPDEPAWVHGDAVMLQQVVVNLLRNALDALRMREAGAHALAPPRIAVQLHTGTPQKGQAARQSARQPELEIRIADNGVGLSAEAESNLFVPFQSTKPTGMGIGLNICRSFIELHQGRLWFTRNPPEHGGCTFHVALPQAGDS
jgi:two-component system, LuxR family, sensor kinase FixL